MAVKIKIEKLDNMGRGIGYIDNKITFVSKTLLNELVDIDIIKKKSKYNIGKVDEIIKPSEQRVDARCPYFKECGGCDLMHIKYEDTLSYKCDNLKSILKKYADLDLDIKIIENKSIYNYRNKISLKIENGKMGYYQEESNQLVPIDCCLVTKAAINDFLKDIKLFNVKNGKIVIRCNYNDELLVIIYTKDDLDINIDFLKQKHKIVGIIINDKMYSGENYFIERINNLFFRVSYNAFFQINNYINSSIFEILKDFFNESINILDLYCGVGSLGLACANKHNSIYGVEMIASATRDALINAKMNKISNAKYFLGDTSDVLPKINVHFDGMIVDPPRSGLSDKTLNEIINIGAKKLAYISCKPMTLARDLKILKNFYKIEKCYLLDMFSYSYHAETMVFLTKKDL